MIQGCLRIVRNSPTSSLDEYQNRSNGGGLRSAQVSIKWGPAGLAELWTERSQLCRYVDYLLEALRRRDLFQWLILSPDAFMHTLLFRDRYNFMAVAARLPERLLATMSQHPGALTQARPRTLFGRAQAKGYRRAPLGAPAGDHVPAPGRAHAGAHRPCVIGLRFKGCRRAPAGAPAGDHEPAPGRAHAGAPRTLGGRVMMRGHAERLSERAGGLIATQWPCIEQFLPFSFGCCQQADAGPLEVEEADDAELEQPEIEQVWTIKAWALSHFHCSHSLAQQGCALQHDCRMPDVVCMQ